MTSALVSQAIQWKVPGARTVVRGGELERWEGPGSPPTPEELAQWITDYQAQGIELDKRADQVLSDKALRAILNALWEAIPAPSLSKSQVLARAKALYKTL